MTITRTIASVVVRCVWQRPSTKHDICLCQGRLATTNAFLFCEGHVAFEKQTHEHTHTHGCCLLGGVTKHAHKHVFVCLMRLATHGKHDIVLTNHFLFVNRVLLLTAQPLTNKSHRSGKNSNMQTIVKRALQFTDQRDTSLTTKWHRLDQNMFCQARFAVDGECDTALTKDVASFWQRNAVGELRVGCN